MLNEFSSNIWDAVFSGNIPGSFLTNTLRAYKRLHKSSRDEFVDIIKGKGLGCRDLDVLAKAWFKGGKEIKDQIKNGNLYWTSKKLQEELKEDDIKQNKSLGNSEGMLI